MKSGRSVIVDTTVCNTVSRQLASVSVAVSDNGFQHNSKYCKTHGLPPSLDLALSSVPRFCSSVRTLQYNTFKRTQRMIEEQRS